MTENKAYYAILPANIRYDKNITPNAKLLYAEITALTNETGYCWATNSYFADLYDVSQNSISNWIKQLVDNKYITSQIVYKEGTKEILGRYIKIFGYPTQKNLDTPTQKICEENNTLKNNTLNNKEKIIKKENEIEMYFTNDKVIEAINNWLDYKKEKHQTYKPKGFTALLKSLKKDSDTYGEQYVIDEINYSMTSNYSGIFANKGYKNYNTSYTQSKPATQITKSYRR